MRARQIKRSPHAPEKLTPTPAVKLRVDITHFLTKGLEGTGRLSVAKDVQQCKQPKQFPIDASELIGDAVLTNPVHLWCSW